MKRPIVLPNRPNRSPNRPALSPNRLVTELVSWRIDRYTFQSLVVTSLWSSAGLTTATVCWLCYLSTWFGVFNRFKTLQHGWFRRSEHITDALASLHWLCVQSASSSKSLYSPTEQWMVVLQCTCRPTSPESLTCHLDWHSNHPPPINWLFHLTTSLLSTGGPFQSPPPISGTVSLHITPHHRRSRFPGSVLRIFSFGAALLSWLNYLTLRAYVLDLAVTLLFRPC